MTPPRGVRIGIATIGSAAVVGGALLGVGSFATAASAITVSPSFDFGVVLPGETRTAEKKISVPFVSIGDGSWTQRSSADWSAQLCAPAGDCTDIRSLRGSTLAAGDYRLVVSVTIPSDIPQGGTAAASGVIRLTERPGALDQQLAATGAAGPLVLGAIGAALAAAGGLAMFFRRREVRS